LIVLTLNEIKQYNVAHDLVCAGLRISIVRWLTDVEVKKLRGWWRVVHNKRPPNGKQKETVLGFVKTNKDAARLTAFALIYMKSYKNLTGEYLLDEWQQYCQTFGYIDVNAAYYVVRDLTAGIISLSNCGVCGAAFIYDKGNRHTEKCPFCHATSAH